MDTRIQAFPGDEIRLYTELQKENQFKEKLLRKIRLNLPNKNFIQAATTAPDAGSSTASEDHPVVSPTAFLDDGVTDLDEYAPVSVMTGELGTSHDWVINHLIFSLLNE
ncbi:unnamed protein product [Rotaria sp. Silwood1]|nr:unnamed protein product [Rotaria sp. Silwood1]